jgi:uncharacterized peroxidase-related enzyme
MARPPIIVPEEAKGKVRGLLADIRKKLGLVPNMTRVMANSPATLEAYIQFSSALEGGSLDAKYRERIALETAEASRCEYCLSAHSAIGKMVGLDDSEILDSRQAQAKDAKANAAHRFSRLILEEHGAVGAADIEAARNGGLTDSEIAEVVGLTVLNIFTNYFNTAFQVGIDFPHP